MCKHIIILLCTFFFPTYKTYIEIFYWYLPYNSFNFINALKFKQSFTITFWYIIN